ncbi:interleukin-1 receptor type 1-like [Xyrichtys novacula]|uniref:Interleukin-1 receptor type 1-like n=1 Tax=Xyrichtys novacula TaxID=13765 RepID=A0AAV1H1C5_XYRNO|nr:interleukin-1 receptor type 1-like [Xyrichtys novacula]
MVHPRILRYFLFFLGSFGICAGFVKENCTYSTHQFGFFYFAPGDVAMLNSTLVSSDVFNFTSGPFNITWYNSKTRQEVKNQTGRILVRGETLWFLNVTLEDNGEYVAILRTPFQCFRQDIKLVMNQPGAEGCGRLKKSFQNLTNGDNGQLSCPLKDYIEKLRSYNIALTSKWYKGCDLLESETEKYSFIDATTLGITKVGPEDKGSFTCTLTFTLDGVTGSVSETIDVQVKEKSFLSAQMLQPISEKVKAHIGSNLSKQCEVFVPNVKKKPSVGVVWLVRGDLIYKNNENHVYTSKKSHRPHQGGFLFQVELIIPKLRKEDFNLNYTCKVDTGKATTQGYFTLERADPDIILPIGLVFGGGTVLFIISVIVYHLLKVDIVLWFRKAFPVLYPNTDLDGKLYDAYVAYPQPCDPGFSEEVEKFALHTLPQILEETCGYQLFIAGRDCLAGQAIVDSVEENLHASRQVLLLYTASTFVSEEHTSKSDKITPTGTDCNSNSERKTTDDNSKMNYDDNKNVYSDTRQQLECVAVMHRALLEGSLKVVLVELEEISPAQLALFPESVRQLRKKQGAVCWWKNLKKRQRSGTCTRREDEEKGGQETKLSPSLSPTSRFWKDMRYHMPVKGKKKCTPRKLPR